MHYRPTRPIYSPRIKHKVECLVAKTRAVGEGREEFEIDILSWEQDSCRYYPFDWCRRDFMESPYFKADVRSRGNNRVVFLLLIDDQVPDEDRLPPLLRCVPGIWNLSGYGRLPDVCSVSSSRRPVSLGEIKDFIPEVSVLEGTEVVLVHVSSGILPQTPQKETGHAGESCGGAESLCGGLAPEHSTPVGRIGIGLGLSQPAASFPLQAADDHHVEVHGGRGEQGKEGGSEGEGDLQGSSREGESQEAVLVLTGPSGIGKSHLALTLVAMKAGKSSPYHLTVEEDLAGKEEEADESGEASVGDRDAEEHSGDRQTQQPSAGGDGQTAQSCLSDDRDPHPAERERATERSPYPVSVVDTDSLLYIERVRSPSSSNTNDTQSVSVCGELKRGHSHGEEREGGRTEKKSGWKGGNGCGEEERGTRSPDVSVTPGISAAASKDSLVLAVNESDGRSDREAGRAASESSEGEGILCTQSVQQEQQDRPALSETEKSSGTSSDDMSKETTADNQRLTGSQRGLPSHLRTRVKETELDSRLRGADAVVVGNRDPGLINEKIILSRLALPPPVSTKVLDSKKIETETEMGPRRDHDSEPEHVNQEGQRRPVLLLRLRRFGHIDHHCSVEESQRFFNKLLSEINEPAR
uniref:G-patch domain-containing protein n=1 Tax=Chromera velia CCMP2878 TaxID=1169474 RepID=A0A0G4F3V9_9ALVE|eukprot:Cvel_152.t1-p1 / transcript=Cvel_152.t1 / gene=Cvel_152 / organism=Chromera_velia_CCMP2878 / gene_product=hypothetical protein / transcript_product=hypothetical protein / location=Cvel_scaffold10:45649-48083(+) / protein_length=638 / sequence_SO=supercontig / SO=protein_coding / is_pseudo=false